MNTNQHDALIQSVKLILAELEAATQILQRDLSGWQVEPAIMGLKQGAITEIGKVFDEICEALGYQKIQYEKLFSPSIAKLVSAAHTSMLEGADYQGMGVMIYAAYSGKSLEQVCIEFGQHS